MTVTVAPSPWPAPSAIPRIVWRFARPVQSADGELGAAVQWVMKRNCSIAPHGLLMLYLSLCVVSLLIAGGFWLAGAPTVMAFAGLELLVLGTALVIYARHATDCETITLAGRELAIEHRCGVALQSASFRADWVRVEPMRDDASLVELSSRGQRACVGRYLRPEWRPQLAHELRQALRRG